MVTTKIEHFENGLKEFSSMKDFMDFAKILFWENEENDTPLRELVTYKDCLIYIMLYCPNFKVLYSDVLYNDNRLFS